MTILKGGEEMLKKKVEYCLCRLLLVNLYRYGLLTEEESMVEQPPRAGRPQGILQDRLPELREGHCGVR